MVSLLLRSFCLVWTLNELKCVSVRRKYVGIFLGSLLSSEMLGKVCITWSQYSEIMRWVIGNLRVIVRTSLVACWSSSCGKPKLNIQKDISHLFYSGYFHSNTSEIRDACHHSIFTKTQTFCIVKCCFHGEFSVPVPALSSWASPRVIIILSHPSFPHVHFIIAINYEQRCKQSTNYSWTSLFPTLRGNRKWFEITDSK